MMTAIAVSLLAVAGFGLALWRGRVVTVAGDAMKGTMAGLSAMTDSELDDDAKEVAVRRAGLALIVASFNLLWRFAVALAAAAVPILLADALGLASREAVLALMLRVDYIVIVSIAAVALTELIRRRRRPVPRSEPGRHAYSTADRFAHILAFSSPAVLKAASRIEDRLLSAPAQAPSAPPIFITSLARGGTTALLNALHEMPGVATHLYRDMPFVTAPRLWNRLSGGRKRQVDRRQRAHGDGLAIDLNSPEAFEEVVWKLFWPEKYRQNAIALWRSADHKPEADRFLQRHMAKIVRARQALEDSEAVETARYCSKNNANIARLPYLLNAFPDCRIVVPLRRPEAHAASLLRQHQNFLQIQAEDEFIKRYMRDIGHFEFGLIHKPLAFPGFDATRHAPTSGDYWLSYWIHAFREVLAFSDHCLIVLQDDLRAAPDATMAALCEALGLAPRPQRFGAHFRAGADEARTDLFARPLYEEATDLYHQLRDRALSTAPGPSLAALP